MIKFILDGVLLYTHVASVALDSATKEAARSGGGGMALALAKGNIDTARRVLREKRRNA